MGIAGEVSRFEADANVTGAGDKWVALRFYLSNGDRRTLFILDDRIDFWSKSALLGRIYWPS